MKTMNFKRMKFLLILLFSSQGNADMLRSIPELIHLHISPERGWAGSVGTLPPIATFGGFSMSDAGQFLTLANGPEFVNLVGTHSAAFKGNLIPDRCVAINSPIPMAFQSWDNKVDLYQSQTKQLNECVQFRIKDISGISPSPEQPACSVVPVNQYEAIARGGLCYFKINPNSAFTVQYELNPECVDENNFQNLDLGPLDIFAYSGFYISGDASGRSNSLRPLGSGVLRFSIEARENAVPLSVDAGESVPRWPVEGFPDVHMAEMNIESKGGETKLLSRLFFRNACTSANETACRFSMPIGVQYTLKEVLSGGATRALDQWYGGGISPALWEGFFASQRNMPNFEFKAGGRYRIEADLTYLSIYHRLFKEGFKSFLVQRGLWTIDPNAPLLPIPPISRMPALDGLRASAPLPLVDPLVPGGGNDFQLELNQLRALLTGVDWPPYFEKMCGVDACANAISGDAKLKVGVDFTVAGFDGSVGKTKDYRVWRASSFASDYNVTTEKIMKADCQ